MIHMNGTGTHDLSFPTVVVLQEVGAFAKDGFLKVYGA